MATLVHELDLPTVDIEALDRRDVIDALGAARRAHWLARTPLGYVVSRHEDVVALLRERRFHSALSLIPQLAGVDAPEWVERRQRQSILSMEGEEHTRVRRLVAPAFTPKSTDRFRPYMREVVDALVEPVAAEGRCELVADVCEPYPIQIICEVLGAPKSDWKLFSAWATDIFRIFNNDIANDLPKIQAATDELDAYVSALIEERRAAPADDLLTDLVAAEEQGDRLTTDELKGLVEAILMAGTDTTRNQLACSVALLAEHPDQWHAIAQDPSLAVGAVEETMRVLGAVRGTMRVAAEDVEYRDVLFPTGTLVAVSLAGANYDDHVWADAETVDIGRERPAMQMTLGSGIHYCLGASLARAELQEALPILARRMPDLVIDGAVEWKPATVGIWGPAVLPLRFTPT